VAAAGLIRGRPACQAETTGCRARRPRGPVRGPCLARRSCSRARLCLAVQSAPFRRNRIGAGALVHVLGAPVSYSQPLALGRVERVAGRPFGSPRGRSTRVVVAADRGEATAEEEHDRVGIL
jgi:hypothetical protein